MLRCKARWPDSRIEKARLRAGTPHKNLKTKQSEQILMQQVLELAAQEGSNNN